MSTIDLQKLGLPQARMKEIIEEDYPSVSLQNRMRMIQQKFAERQLEEPKDIFGPPKNLTDVGFRFESVFNSLLGYMKQLLTSSDKVISVSEITQILQTYSQLASIYNSFVVNELPSNELFRRQIYEKLDMLASLAGKLYTDTDNGIFRFSDPLTMQTLRQDIQEPNEFEQLRLRQQPILAPRLQALTEDLENKFMKAMEQIRRDALTRKLRLVDFGNDTPLPGQVRAYVREGEAPPPPPGQDYPWYVEENEPRYGRPPRGPIGDQPHIQPQPPRAPRVPQVQQVPQPQPRAQRGQPGIDERRQQQLEAVERRRIERQEARDEYLDAPGNLTRLIADAMERLPMQERDLIVHYIRMSGYDPEQIHLIPIPVLRGILNTIRDMVQQVEPQQQEQQLRQQQEDFEQMFQRQQQQQQPPGNARARRAARRRQAQNIEV